MISFLVCCAQTWRSAENFDLEAPVRSAAWAPNGRDLAVTLHGSPHIACVRARREYLGMHTSDATVTVEVVRARINVCDDLVAWVDPGASRKERRQVSSRLAAREVAWDPSGERLAVSFCLSAAAEGDDDGSRGRGAKRARLERGAGGRGDGATVGDGDGDGRDGADSAALRTAATRASELISVYAVRPSRSLEIKVLGIISAEHGTGLPSLLRFSHSFTGGALLCATYENGLLRWWPMLFDTATERARRGGGASTVTTIAALNRASEAVAGGAGAGHSGGADGADGADGAGGAWMPLAGAAAAESDYGAESVFSTVTTQRRPAGRLRVGTPAKRIPTTL